MAMVNIKKGNDKLKVPKGVFLEYYKRNGWKIMGSNEVVSDNSDLLQDELETSGNIDNHIEEENDLEENVGSDGEHKPLSDMSIEELQSYAKELDVDIDGLTTKKEIKRAIRSVLGE